ncbi:hypothetical protein F3Y22_tig00018481pilonHSYRG00007 [Hibiscus syriacus]|uniref:Transcriptional factor DELLA N-terminal domain-containing protein n=1 Tax=Hibiscus syriacus TaxID=106335 RepID=A0A6A3BVP5_HIBSY|nr:hypothetical protein F3Y22_tig00018481pilonHSYRG00007 [Hibiscus syriacus]
MHSGRPSLAQTERMNVLHMHSGRPTLARLPLHSSLGCPCIAHSDGLGQMLSDSLGRMASDAQRVGMCTTHAISCSSPGRHGDLTPFTEQRESERERVIKHERDYNHLQSNPDPLLPLRWFLNRKGEALGGRNPQQDCGWMRIWRFLGYKVKTSDMVEVAQKLEQLNEVMCSVQDDGISHLAFETVIIIFRSVDLS